MIEFDFDKEIILENDTVILEPLHLSHVSKLVYSANQHPELLQYSPSIIVDQRTLEAYIQEALNARKNQSRYALAIYDKVTKEFAGSTSFGNVSNKDQRLEIGWTWIAKKFQGTGFNKQCKKLMLTFVFENLEFDRIEFKIDKRNVQSQKAVEKIGGKYEGNLRSHTLMSDGFRRDTVYYGILKSEWPEIKKTIFND